MINNFQDAAKLIGVIAGAIIVANLAERGIDKAMEKTE